MVKSLPSNIEVQISPREVAADCLRSAKNDPSRAKELMEARVRKDDALFRALMAPLVSSACDSAVRDVLHGTRRGFTPVVVDATQRGERLSTAISTLLRFALPVTGKPLAEATGEECRAAAAYYADQANAYSHRARWFDAIADKVKARVVGKVLREDDLRELMQATQL